MRIAIVNDIFMNAEILRRIVASSTDHEVAWIASNGKEAVEKCQKDTPDLILLDLLMPVMDGVQATQLIMQKTPCAILIVTSSVQGNSPLVFEAMSYGALDVVKAPEFSSEFGNTQANELLYKIEMIGKLIGKTVQLKEKIKAHSKTPILIAIGASTGGPKALVQMLAALPKILGAAPVIVQHIDEQFSSGLVRWIGSQIKLPTQLISRGDSPKRDEVLIAGTNDHLVLTKNLTLDYTPYPTEIFYRPSVNVFFKSLSELWPVKSIAVLLTGMGKDGAEGMKALHDKGWHTIVENQESCVIYGMPKAAIELDAVDEVLSVEKIPEAILKQIRILRE